MISRSDFKNGTEGIETDFRTSTRYTNILRRAEVLQAIRTTLASRGYIEVETPVRITAPIPERYIDAIPADNAYLAPSPERDMKKLLTEGFPAIFQISKCFRKGERGKKHSEEFTLLEWYCRATSGEILISDVKEIVCAATKAVCNSSVIRYKDMTISCEEKWERISVDDAYKEYAEFTLPPLPDDTLFDTLMTEKIEPYLGQKRPCILYDYPSSVSPFSALHPDKPDRALRYELYIAGVEIANGCLEQNDSDILMQRVRAERMYRKKRGADPYPPSDDFIKQTAGMPSVAGMALGIDRLMMLLCDAESIDDVVTYIE